MRDYIKHESAADTLSQILLARSYLDELDNILQT